MNVMNDTKFSALWLRAFQGGPASAGAAEVARLAAEALKGDKPRADGWRETAEKLRNPDTTATQRAG